MKSYKEELKEFIEIYDYIDGMEHTLLYEMEEFDRDTAYKMLYDKAFSKEVNRRMQEIFPFDWYDPDAGYDDDYNAWKSKADEIAEKIKGMLSKMESRNRGFMDDGYDS